MARDFYEFGSFRLDHARRRLLRDGGPVILTPKVFDTLLVLVEHHGQSLSRSELIALIWPDTSVGEHNLNQSIAVLRKVLDDNPRQPDYIATLPGRGYSFIAEVRSAEAGSGNQPAQVPANGNPGPGGLPIGLSSAPVLSAVESVAPPPATTSGIIRRQWQYAAAGLSVVVLVAALTIASPLGSRVRLNARPMMRSMQSIFSPAPPRSVSVLPFEDLGISSAEPGKQYIA